jgi:hypothetical protein
MEEVPRDVVGVTSPDGTVELQWRPGQRTALCSRELLDGWVELLNDRIRLLAARCPRCGEWVRDFPGETDALGD